MRATDLYLQRQVSSASVTRSIVVILVRWIQRVPAIRVRISLGRILRHLHVENEILGSQLHTLHNLHFYLSLKCEGIRRAIYEGSFAALAEGKPDIGALVKLGQAAER